MAHILIVDDDRDMLQMLRLLMESERHSVVLAENAWEALLRLRDSQFDLILLDILMPGFDGTQFLQILRILRNSIPGRNIPVIVVTALDRDVAEERIATTRVEGIVIKKPTRLIEDVLGQVRRLVGSGHPAARDGETN